jgi:hypothetical protein
LVRRALAQAGCSAAGCRARIIGGWEREDDDRGHFGVRLDLTFPVVVEIWSNKRRVEQATTARTDSNRIDSNRVDSNRVPPPKSGRGAKRLILALLGLVGAVAIGGLLMQSNRETIRQPSSPVVNFAARPAKVAAEGRAATADPVPLPRPRPPLRITP